jgi:D-arabinose 1-dehydrogenase-like Zn-dependent alcohol dehydrogenase
VVSVQTRLVLATLCVFNGVVLAALGIGSVIFVDGIAGLGLAGVMWAGAAALLVLARRLRHDVEWR